MIRLKLFVLLMMCAGAIELNAATCGAAPDKISSGVTAYALSGLNNPTSFSIVDRGAATYDSAGTGSGISVGYARMQANSGSTTPSGYLIFSYRQNGVLVSEATVPATRPISAGRIYAAVSGPVNTGVAVVNPNSTDATISFYFTDTTGQNSATRSFTLPANTQIARFLTEAPFSVSGMLSGTMTVSSNVPVGVLALRGFTNERGEFLMTTLPVADLNAPMATGVVLLPHSASGAGWMTQVVLVNPTDSAISGSVRFQDGLGLQYSIAPRSMQRVVMSSGSTVLVGAIRVTPDSGTASPSGLAIFSYNNGVTVSEAGVPVLSAGTAFRMFEIECGSYPGQLSTGIAIANVSTTDSAPVLFELTDLSGRSVGTSTLTLAPGGQAAKFVKELSGFENLPYPFHGNLRISTTSAAGIAVLGLRGDYNERKEFLMTTSMPTNEAAPATAAEALFPHLADGGGYTTELVLFSGSAGQASTGMLRFFTQSGAPAN